MSHNIAQCLISVNAMSSWGLFSNCSVVIAREGGYVVILHEIASADLVSPTVTHKGVIANVTKQSRRGELAPVHCGHYCFDVIQHLEIRI